jgi:multidrug efflux system outer membrane protein
MNRTLLAPAFALVLMGCASGPPIDTAALPATPVAFKERDPRFTLASPAEAQPRGTWWKAFGDPVLDDLIVRADRANASIQVAAAHVTQARALLKAADADRMPQLDLGAAAVRGDGLTVTNLPAGSPRTLYALTANVSYEVDLFGRLAQASHAAKLDANAAEALLRSTKLLVEADVAQAYLGLRALDDERALVRRTVAAYQATLSLTERRYRAGDVAELDVSRARTEVAATESDALALDRRRAELEHAIAVLVGEPASTFSIQEADWNTALPQIPAGVPATVLTRRPDVSAAQDQMLAAQARAGVAKAAWFPSISLTGLGGRASTDLSDIFLWPRRVWAIGALLTQPIFDGGRREAGIEFAGGEMDAAVARYREQVLVAFQDVEDQLAALRLLAEQSDAQARAVASATRTTALSDARYRNGLVSQLELLDAQRSELRNRTVAVEVRSAQYQATVGLVRALGGGWGEGS